MKNHLIFTDVKKEIYKELLPILNLVNKTRLTVST